MFVCSVLSIGFSCKREDPEGMALLYLCGKQKSSFALILLKLGSLYVPVFQGHSDSLLFSWYRL